MLVPGALILGARARFSIPPRVLGHQLHHAAGPVFLWSPSGAEHGLGTEGELRRSGVQKGIAHRRDREPPVLGVPPQRPCDDRFDLCRDGGTQLSRSWERRVPDDLRECVVGELPRQQLIEQNAETVDVVGYSERAVALPGREARKLRR